MELSSRGLNRGFWGQGSAGCCSHLSVHRSNIDPSVCQALCLALGIKKQVRCSLNNLMEKKTKTTKKKKSTKSTEGNFYTGVWSVVRVSGNLRGGLGRWY